MIDLTREEIQIIETALTSHSMRLLHISECLPKDAPVDYRAKLKAMGDRDYDKACAVRNKLSRYCDSIAPKGESDGKEEPDGNEASEIPY